MHFGYLNQLLSKLVSGGTLGLYSPKQGHCSWSTLWKAEAALWEETSSNIEPSRSPPGFPFWRRVMHAMYTYLRLKMQIQEYQQSEKACLATAFQESLCKCRQYLRSKNILQSSRPRYSVNSESD